MYQYNLICINGYPLHGRLVVMATAPLLAVCAHQFHAFLQAASRQPRKLDTQSVFVWNLLTAKDFFNSVKLLGVAWTHYQRGMLGSEATGVK